MKLIIPRNALEFDERYLDESQCRQALVSARWPKGFVCRKCRHPNGFQLHTRPLIECARCHAQHSVTAGTLFHNSKLPLRTLFKMLYLLVAEKSGTNMSALARQVGVNYSTAMLWARKARTAMGRRERSKLSGTVEVDECSLGGPAEGHPGRSLGANQALLVVMVEDRDGACGRARIEVIDQASGDQLSAVVKEEVEVGSTVKTDAWSGYQGLTGDGFQHAPRRASGRAASRELPLVHRVISLLKRFVNGVLHGSWTHTWLPLMLDEFVFRFNRRNSRSRPLLFHRLLEIGAKQRPPTRRALQLYAHIMAA